MTLIEDLRQEGRADLADSVGRVEEFVQRWWHGGALLPWFTDHGPDHSKRVSDYCRQIADIPDLPNKQRLTLLERYILHTAAWLHDIGMQSLGLPAGTLVPADYDRIRHEHPEASLRRILDTSRPVGLIDDPTLEGVVAFVAQGHGTKYFFDSVGKLESVTHVLGEPVRGGLLTAILLLGDEMDLDARRVKPMPADQPLNPLSQAHAVKHRRVVASGVEHRPQCRVRLYVRLEESPQDDSQSHELELWIVEKLRMQLAMVDSVFTSGFGGAAELDRTISVKYQPCLGNGTPISKGVLRIIEDENRAAQLIDHKISANRIKTVLDRHGMVLVTGRMSGWEDVDGREDIMKALVAVARTQGKNTAESRALYETAGSATLRDVLMRIRKDLEMPTVDTGDLMILADEALKFVSGSADSFLIAISSVDNLPRGQQEWLHEHVASPISNLENVSLMMTADRESDIARWDNLELVHSYGMESSEVEWYLRRYTGARPAKVEAQQSLRYSKYKALRQSYLAEMAGL